MAGLKSILLEPGADILSGASKGNSALLHTGYDAPTNSLELHCVRAGYREYLEIRERLSLFPRRVVQSKNNIELMDLAIL
jgi:glycerol-3-phosphate dehydrogenase